MNDLQKQIKDLHEPSLKGIISVLIRKGTFKKWPLWISLLVGVCFAITILCCDSHSFLFIKSFSELCLAVFPNLLGFTLGGFAIVVGFSNTTVIEEGINFTEHSIYQKLNAIFSLTIIVQIFVTILAFGISSVIKIEESKLLYLDIGFIGEIINIILIAILTFSAIYSLFLLPYVVTNLFSLGQVNNAFFTAEKIKKIIEAKKKSQPEKEG